MHIFVFNLHVLHAKDLMSLTGPDTHLASWPRKPAKLASKCALSFVRPVKRLITRIQQMVSTFPVS